MKYEQGLCVRHEQHTVTRVKCLLEQHVPSCGDHDRRLVLMHRVRKGQKFGDIRTKERVPRVVLRSSCARNQECSARGIEVCTMRQNAQCIVNPDRKRSHNKRKKIRLCRPAKATVDGIIRPSYYAVGRQSAETYSLVTQWGVCCVWGLASLCPLSADPIPKRGAPRA